jgi:membrane protein required for colicin V production
MTYIDYIILAVLLLFFFKGLKSGLIRQVLSLVAIILGFILAWKFYATVSVLGVKLGIPQYFARIGAFALIYILVVIFFHFLAVILEKIFKFIPLGWLNRLLGAVFGLGEGVILVIIVLVVLSFTPVQKSIETKIPKSPVLKFMEQLASPFQHKAGKIKSPPEILV